MRLLTDTAFTVQKGSRMRNKLSLSLSVFLLLVAINLLSTSARAQRGLSVGHPSAPQPPGRFHALVIGNNAYSGMPRLKTAGDDARAVEALLRESYGFETKLLLDATRQQTISALYSYRQTLEPDSSLLVYYAGHGYKDHEEQKAYWLPVDAARDDPSNWIMADEVTTRIKVMPSRHVIVVSDSCYSGTLMRGIGEAPPRAGERAQFLQRMMAGRSRTLMASGGDEPVADGGGGKHSVFANALLRGLREMNKDGFTAAELFRSHVEESVGGRAQQMPEYQALRGSGHESGDFVFVRARPNGERAGATTAAPPPDERPLMESEPQRALMHTGDMKARPASLKERGGKRLAPLPRQDTVDTGDVEAKREGDAGSKTADSGSQKAIAAETSSSNTTNGERAPSARDSRLAGDAGKRDARARMTAADSSMRQPQSAREVFQPRTASGDAGRGRRP